MPLVRHLAARVVASRGVVPPVVAGLALILGFSSCTPPMPPDTGPDGENVAVTPNTDLVDGQEITIHGWGYSANAPVGVIQCKTPAAGYEDCSGRTAHSLSTDANGAYEISYNVTRILRFGNGREHDCAVPDSCYLVSVYPHGFYGRAAAPLHFSPGQAVSAWPNAKLTDQQEIQVKGYGYGAHASVGIVQCPKVDPRIDRCDGRTADSFSADADGNFTRQMTVYEVIEDAHGVKTDCRVPDSCVVAAVWVHGFQGLATDDLRFLPDAG